MTSHAHRFSWFGINATMVPNNYTFGVSISSSQYIRHDEGSSIIAHRIIKTSLPKFERTGSSKTPLVEFLRPRYAKYLVPYMRHGGGVSLNTGSSKTMIIKIIQSFYMAQNLWKTQSLTWKREIQDYRDERLWVGKSLTKQMGLEVTFERVWEHCEYCLEANSKQQK